ncbi:MAG: GGDEF domain-containing protein [Gemmatimonadaceae bacterium]|nr:GGDEF domain-containing protein [Gemmatimonadaceae bacterium]NUO95829.1 GGDEF domain-containing protein [Gemmatimonadaceae bacterium]NUP56152.1 GGDEF domain-containing protein [Gemmatimonadaceae bacterium]NUP70157.1 GGDEF domain-containing protein [Gemmatimonadaceae bacterium]NUR34019.1 GGDEF domain-containing protein [Gemmatimonadaceae bacterium]
MSRPEADPQHSTTGSYAAGATLELPATTPELLEALRHDREALVREAVLWQRWIRYLGLAALVALAVLFGRNRAHMLLPVAGVALGYVLCVTFTAGKVQRAATIHEIHIPAFLVTADVVALGAITWLSGPPSDAARILLAGLLVVQLAVFYFGRWLGTYSAIICAVAYVMAAELPARVLGTHPTLTQLLSILGLFAMVCAVLITAYGSFRARMNQLRLFCKLVEDGDLTPAFTPGTEKRPDDLTLLARSFDAMRMRLAEQIGTDPLTGCLNRRALETRLRAEWRQAKRRGATVAVLAVDLDHFKSINDSRGHPFGDVVLQELAAIMKATARDTDAVARTGGDEFVIVLPDTGWQGALTFAERLRRKVDDFSFGAAAGAIGITISVGVALARGTDPVSPEMLLQEADRSLYKAKTGGRNRIFA